MGNCGSVQKPSVWVRRHPSNLKPYNALRYFFEKGETLGELLQRVDRVYYMTYVNIYSSDDQGQCDLAQQLQPDLLIANFLAGNDYHHPLWFTATDDVLLISIQRAPRTHSKSSGLSGGSSTGTLHERGSRSATGAVTTVDEPSESNQSILRT